MKSLKYRLITILVLSSLFVPKCSYEDNGFITSADGVQIKYYTYGKGDPTLVFVHGFASDHLDWEFQRTHFSKNHKVVIVELAGFGKSGNNRTNWTAEAFGQDVVSVMKHLKQTLTCCFLITSQTSVPGYGRKRICSRNSRMHGTI